MSIFNCLNPIYTMSSSDQQLTTYIGINWRSCCIFCMYRSWCFYTYKRCKKFENQEIDEHGNRPDRPNL